MLVIPITLNSAISGEITTLETLVIANVGGAASPRPYMFNYEGWLFGPEKPYDPLKFMLEQAEDAIAHAFVNNYPQRDLKGKFTPTPYLVACMLDRMGIKAF